MYAVIESGGKQHRVIEGETLKLEKIEVPTGETIEFDRVLMVGGAEIKIGTIKIIKFNRRKHFRKETGHRQWFTEVKITGITA
jgi:large subunit ribosomal protein L21